MGKYGRSRRQSRRAALCGLMAALAVVILCLGGMVPLASVACPMLASLCLLPAMCEYGPGAALAQYAVSAALGLLLCPDLEASMLYVFLGWYPALRPRLEKLPSPLRPVAKGGIFALAASAMYALLLFLFRLEAVVDEFAAYSAVMVAGLLLMGCAVFLVFDRSMGLLWAAYRRRQR